YIQKEPATEDNSGVVETRKLTGCIFGQVNNSLLSKKQDDFFTLKGVLEGLFEKLGLSKRVVYSQFRENDRNKY
ncbi:MAG: hypothetical protein IJW73_04980, partial [Candidatus Gastranaerophilales bacterium]|nr:hypothetical protein [Candidatus Gastranaerophilales bacterium]